jgi:hypothetical protein
MDYRIISADDHIDMQWLPKDRAPKVIDTAALEKGGVLEPVV